ncbi:2-hydroxyacid dehydrogenase [Tateyamaria sp. ANG-S1]|uniref:2-hydroxyacid dehydrogenase n=1 Tax=Tateyamaria sp. ANG-S1 TaxID=1577905 RepID=UPI00057C84BA|nr:2-hydroxyacid dehydrogenase [Tateyamaria sp. ANG-S1]KIC49586.1 2-hydroxyacid dehydrogenase [Tateyamaria sp. ANG-S1]
MPDLLQIGGITDSMRTRLEERFTIHQATDDYPGEAITHIVTNGHDGVPADILASCPNAKMAASYGVGYDAIDTDACVERGIVVTHTPDVLNAEVASTAIMLMLNSFRNFMADEAHARSGNWETQGNAPLSRSADNRRVGILGLGRIGQAIADKLKAFNADIHYHTRSEKDVPYTYHANLVDMAKAVEVIICITPGGPSTHHIVNAEVMEALGPEGTLINVSRGSVIDEAAMVAALQSGKLGYAALDVFEEEPKIPDALKSMSNVILLPHVGSATHETRAAMGTLVVDNLISHLDNGLVITPVPETKHLNG